MELLYFSTLDLIKTTLFATTTLPTTLLKIGCRLTTAQWRSLEQGSRVLPLLVQAQG